MTLPARMTAIGIRAPGGPEMLVPEERPVPTPGDGEILVKVAAAGVNRPDVMQRMGLYPPPKGAPDIPGLEIAGMVAARGPGATRWKVGDAVGQLLDRQQGQVLPDLVDDLLFRTVIVVDGWHISRIPQRAAGCHTLPCRLCALGKLERTWT